MLQRYDFMVVDPTLDSRMKLKQMAQHVVTFGKFIPISNLDEAAKRIQEGEPVDVIFISDKFSIDLIAPFIGSSKGTPIGSDASYVLVRRNGEQPEDVIAKLMLIGIDAFLEEPYSVDGLVEVTELTTRLKNEYATTRKRAAVEMLLKGVMKQITTIAQLKTYSPDSKRQYSKLQEMMKGVEALDEEAKEIYMELAPEVFAAAPLPSVPQFLYKGVSARAKKKMDSKLTASLLNDLESSDHE